MFDDAFGFIFEPAHDGSNFGGWDGSFVIFGGLKAPRSVPIRPNRGGVSPDDLSGCPDSGVEGGGSEFGGAGRYVAGVPEDEDYWLGLLEPDGAECDSGDGEEHCFFSALSLVDGSDDLSLGNICKPGKVTR